MSNHHQSIININSLVSSVHTPTKNKSVKSKSPKSVSSTILSSTRNISDYFSRNILYNISPTLSNDSDLPDVSRHTGNYMRLNENKNMDILEVTLAPTILEQNEIDQFIIDQTIKAISFLEADKQNLIEKFSKSDLIHQFNKLLITIGSDILKKIDNNNKQIIINQLDKIISYVQNNNINKVKLSELYIKQKSSDQISLNIQSNQTSQEISDKTNSSEGISNKTSSSEGISDKTNSSEGISDKTNSQIASSSKIESDKTSSSQEISNKTSSSQEISNKTSSSTKFKQKSSSSKKGPPAKTISSTSLPEKSSSSKKRLPTKEISSTSLQEKSSSFKKGLPAKIKSPPLEIFAKSQPLINYKIYKNVENKINQTLEDIDDSLLQYSFKSSFKTIKEDLGEYMCSKIIRCGNEIKVPPGIDDYIMNHICQYEKTSKIIWMDLEKINNVGFSRMDFIYTLLSMDLNLIKHVNGKFSYRG